MSADKRSVATDALATLGTIIDAHQKRDAIHLAVEPVIAGERMSAWSPLLPKEEVLPDKPRPFPGAQTGDRSNP